MRSKTRYGKHLIIDSFLGFVGLLCAAFFLFSPLPVEAANIDFSGAKDFFKDINIGDRVEGDLSDNSFANPYATSGAVQGYKLTLNKEVDIKKLDIKVQSCAFKLAFFCAGDTFDEVIYILNNTFEPVEGEYKQKERVDFGAFTMPQDRVVYLLVGTEKQAPSGQYTLTSSYK